MVEIPSGTFQMGSTSSAAQEAFEDANRFHKDAKYEWFSWEQPQHQVNVSGFAMGKYEVTQAQWQAIMGNNPSEFKGDLNLPVEKVSWEDAQEFCRKLSARTGKNYRLPTEAEWEYAARAGTITAFAFGSTINTQIVNYDGNYPYQQAAKGSYRKQTVPVGSLGAANGFGLFDMHGNVWEWCEDVWHESYVGAPSDGSAWLSGGNSSRRVVRGGSWYFYGWHCRSAARSWNAPGSRYVYLGFRVVAVSRTQ
jgi:formylglycine-generating enzyme required for sulfatase activity